MALFEKITSFLSEEMLIDNVPSRENYNGFITNVPR
jgi:hypothetical protein